MPGLFSFAEKLWMKLPASFRLGFVGQRVKEPIRRLLVRHDDIYDRTYYEDRRPAVRASARAMARSLVDHLSPDRVVDVGCGTGDLLAALRDLGVPGTGLEYSTVALEACRREGLDVVRFDLERPPAERVEPADLVVSTEVAEHLPASAAEGYVDLLARLAQRRVVFTAAPPGQGGLDHVNEQPPSYWVEKFERRSLRLDEQLGATLAEEWARTEEILPQYHRNLLVFERIPT